MVRGVDRGADADLLNRRADELVDRDDVARAGRLRQQRNELGKVDVLLFVEVPGVPGWQLDEVFEALLLLQPAARLAVCGEDRTGRAELGDHVRDRPSLGVAERVHAGTGELEDAAAATPHPATAEQLQDHVLRLDPRTRELVLEEDADDLRAGQLEWMARHADRDVEPARADRDHRARARLGRVGVGADQRLPRLREPLAVEVVADAVAGP